MLSSKDQYKNSMIQRESQSLIWEPEFYDFQSQWRKLWGVGGEGNCPHQFNKTRKFSVEVGNFEGGIEPLRSKEIHVEWANQMLTLCLQHIFKL